MSAALSVPASILELPDGLHAGIPEYVYHARIPGVASKSVLDLVDRSPAHYMAWLQGADREEPPALAFGKAFHAALLEPDVYRATYTVQPRFGDCRRTENKARRDEWLAENAHRTLLEQADATTIEGMIRSIQADKLASRLLCTEGESELTVKWTDPDTGIICKSRADHYLKTYAVCVDVKTTEDARAAAAAKSVANYGYNRQASLYSDGFAAVGAPLAHFIFVFVEKRPPYAVAVFNLDDDAIVRGRERTRRSLDTLADCIESGNYPAYPAGIETLSLPRWA